MLEERRDARGILAQIHRIREQMWEERQKSGDEAWRKQINDCTAFADYLRRCQTTTSK